MNAHKPTFKPSPAQRPFVQRLTPLAWVFIGVVAVALVLGVAGCVMTLTGRPTDEPWDPTATATSVPTETPVPTAGPSPTPTVWFQEIVTPTVDATGEVTAAHPAWWSDQMTQDAEGNWWPPEEVDAMVKEHYLTYVESRNAVFPEDGPPDLNALEELNYEWYSGPQLEAQIRILEDQRNGGVIYESEIDSIYLEIQKWSADGMESTLGATIQGIKVSSYNALTGELIETLEMESQLALWRMRYDPWSGHWKMYELIDFYD